MFKSSEKLRQEAAARQLDRVASSWRQARTTWFDGTPEAIEARLAETNRILTVARSGYSPAHIGLTVEAENARKELLAAKHRLLTDFLDDGARAFQGSRRVGYGEHSMRDRIDEAYENGGRLDRSLVGVNPGDGIYRNHPGMLDGYDEGPYMGSEYGYDAGSDPDFVPADYLGPAPYQGGEPGLHRRDAAFQTAGYEDDYDGGWDRHVEEQLAPKSIGAETTEDGHPVHTFDSTGQAYNECQTNENIKTGDILHIPSEGVVGMADTWPVAVTKNSGELHAYGPDVHADPSQLDTEKFQKYQGPTSEHFSRAMQYAHQNGYHTGPYEGN